MEEKKKFILEQVGRLYLKHGIRSVTMDDVSHELGISKKTFYQYFKDKEDLVNQVVDVYFLNNPNIRLTQIKGGNAIDRIMNVRRHMVKMFKLVHNNLEYDLRKSYPRVYKKIIKFKREKIYEDNFSVMEQGKQEGLFREDVDSDFMARLAVGRFLLVFNPDNGIFTDEEVRDIHLFDQTMEYHFHGICTETGLKYFKQQLNNVQNEN
ncbi:MAG TPA: TetR/AcrR family transcriptional regulator [Sunxiuqinia sp.]|nr:TetR/AcrR family transcriptional regulator [Sunxiuqinia sp.]